MACEPDDVVCAALGLAAPIAAGAAQKLEAAASSPGVATPSLRLESARNDVATIEDQVVTGVSAGMTAIVLSTKGGLVMDFVHVWIAEPTRLGLHRRDGGIATTEEIEETIQLIAGDEIVLSAALYRGDDLLLGAAETTWTVEGDGVTLLNEGVGGRRRLVAREPGTVRVVVASLGLESAIEVEVTP